MSKYGHVYLCCGKMDAGRYCIACDNCDEWFHIRCIAMTRPSANAIENYYCEYCRMKDETLQIIYRPLPRTEQVKKEDECEEETAEEEIRRCGQCPACRRCQHPENFCRQCVMCKKDKPLCCYDNFCLDLPAINARPIFKICPDLPPLPMLS